MSVKSLKLFSCFRFREFFFELVDPLLQHKYTRVEQPHIEKRHVIGGRIKGVAVAQPRRIVDFDVCEAQLLQDARGLRRTRATLAIDNRFLVGVESCV